MGRESSALLLILVHLAFLCLIVSASYIGLPQVTTSSIRAPVSKPGLTPMLKPSPPSNYKPKTTPTPGYSPITSQTPIYKQKSTPPPPSLPPVYNPKAKSPPVVYKPKANPPLVVYKHKNASPSPPPAYKHKTMLPPIYNSMPYPKPQLPPLPMLTPPPPPKQTLSPLPLPPPPPSPSPPPPPPSPSPPPPSPPPPASPPPPPPPPPSPPPSPPPPPTPPPPSPPPNPAGVTEVVSRCSNAILTDTTQPCCQTKEPSLSSVSLEEFGNCICIALSEATVAGTPITIIRVDSFVACVYGSSDGWTSTFFQCFS